MKGLGCAPAYAKGKIESKKQCRGLKRGVQKTIVEGFDGIMECDNRARYAN